MNQQRLDGHYYGEQYFLYSHAKVENCTSVLKRTPGLGVSWIKYINDRIFKH